MNAWISLGKRKGLPPLEIDLQSTRIHAKKPVSLKNRETVEGSQVNKLESLQVNMIQHPKKEKAKFELMSDAALSFEFPGDQGDRPYFIHPRLKVVKDLLLEACLIDRIDVSRYRALDERQRSLINKILTYKFQKELLDVLDMGGLKTIDTEEYLTDLAREHAEKVVMYLRLRHLIDTIKPSENETKTSSQPSLKNSLLTAHYMGDMIQENLKGPWMDSCSLYQEMDNLRYSAIKAIEQGLSHQWLKAMAVFLNDLAHVSQEDITSEYEKSLEYRLCHIFLDKDDDINSFFAKLKAKFKEGKAVLPLTAFELKRGNQAVVNLLKSQISLIRLYLEKSHNFRGMDTDEEDVIIHESAEISDIGRIEDDGTSATCAVNRR